MKELKNNVNTLLWLMVTLSVMMMFSLVCLSSCKSSVDQGGKITPPKPDQKITITYSCSDNNGTVEAKIVSSKEGKVVDGNRIINLVSGDKIQFTAKPNDGYKFKEWIPKKLGNKETFELTVSEDLKDLSVSVEPVKKETLTVEKLKTELKVKDKDEKAKKGSIVTSLYGLGLIKEDGQFKYQMLVDGQTVAKTGKELINMLKNDDTDYIEQSGGPNLGDKFDTLPSILEAKWNFAKNSEKIVPKEFKMLEFSKIKSNTAPKEGLYQILQTGYYITYKNNEMYVRVSGDGSSYFADWTFAFVSKTDSEGVYVFDVKAVDMFDEAVEIKPYLLRDIAGYKKKGYEYLPDLKKQDEPILDPESYEGMPTSTTYKFNLENLVIYDIQKRIFSLLDSKGGKYVLVLKDGEKENEKVEKLSKDFLSVILNDYDVYMTIGAYRDPNGKIYTNRGSFRKGW